MISSHSISSHSDFCSFCLPLQHNELIQCLLSYLAAVLTNANTFEDDTELAHLSLAPCAHPSPIVPFEPWNPTQYACLNRLPLFIKLQIVPLSY